MKQKQSFMRARALIKALGQLSLTSTQAKKLDALGLIFDDLFTLYLQSGTREAFLAALKAKGIRGKLLGEKLVKALARSRLLPLHHQSLPPPVSYTASLLYSRRPLLLEFCTFFNRLFSELLHHKRFLRICFARSIIPGWKGRGSKLVNNYMFVWLQF